MELRRIATALIVLAMACLLPMAALAQDDEEFIKYRQKVMSGLSANMGGIGDILKQKLPMQGNITNHAAAISAGAKNIAAAFDKKITAGKTDAKDKIWGDMKEFVGKADDLAKEADTLAKVAAGGDMGAIAAQVKKVGGACGGCHKEFRKPKEESYKNKM